MSPGRLGAHGCLKKSLGTQRCLLEGVGAHGCLLEGSGAQRCLLECKQGFPKQLMGTKADAAFQGTKSQDHSWFSHGT